MRNVIVYKMKRDADTGRFERVETGMATFHAWGYDYEEFENGPGNFSTAIVERKDGTVENVPVDMIRFVGDE